MSTRPDKSPHQLVYGADNLTYTLHEVRIKTPAEHWIQGVYADLELQFIHRGIKDYSQVAVFSVMFDSSTNYAENKKLFEPLIDAVSQVASFSQQRK
jgi:carbonic anhydrase